MTGYDRFFENNKIWAADKSKADGDFFTELAKGQNPDFLVIGCSDSRVPIESIVNADPGEIFVHRNIANLVKESDPNLMSVIEFAVNKLDVKHIIVLGHTHCGGVKAYLDSHTEGYAQTWIADIQKVEETHSSELEKISDPDSRYNRLIELNTIEQCKKILSLDVVKTSFQNKGTPTVHGWIFDIESGRLIDLYPTPQ